MKTLKLLVSIGLLAIFVSACTGGDPSSVARAWLKASTTSDGATSLKLTCEDYRQQVQMSGFLAAGLGRLVGVDTQSAKADMSGLKFQTTSQNGDSATVHVEGEMIVSLLGAAMPQRVNQDLTMVREGGAWKVCGWD